MLREWKYVNFDLERQIQAHNTRVLKYKWGTKISDESAEGIRIVYSVLKETKVTETKVTAFRSRIEGSYVTFFSNDENFLFDLTSKMVGGNAIQYVDVCRPKSDEHAGKLIAGSVNSTMPYKYKAVTRVTEMTQDEKSAILNILNQDEHKINDRLRRTLSESHKHVLQSYFYTNDMKIMTLISLIHPMFIKKIHTIISD